MSDARPIPLGPFDLLQPAGRGAMAEVWQATHRGRRVPVAIKVVTAPAGRAQRFRQMFVDEVRATARLDHPGVIRLHDHGAIPPEVTQATRGRLPHGALYLVMEWIPGSTLRGRRGRLSWPALRSTLLSLLDALAHAHARGVIHRDLKAANVLIAERGPVLTDFGLAFDREHIDAELESSARLGTPNFMAPEQVAGDWRALGPWTDLYALGCLAYALANGKAPFAGRGARRIMRAHLDEDPPPLIAARPVPAGFEEWIRRLMQKDPSRRYQFAADAAIGLLTLPDHVDPGPSTAEETEPDLALEDMMAVGIEDVTLVTPPVFLPLDDVSWAAGPAAVDGRPPVPPSWHGPPPPPPEPPLPGVGRALFGLRESALFGREDTRDRLWAALREATLGRTRAMVLEGPAGQGKSHLAAWLGHRAHELGAAEPLVAVHDDVGSPRCGLGPMLEVHLRCADLYPDQRLDRVRRALGDPIGLDPELPAALVAAMDARGRYDDAATAVALSSAQERYETVCRALARFAARRPLLLWFDDVQWGLDALQFTEYMLDRYPELPVMVVATARDDVLRPGGPEAQAVERLAARPAVERARVEALDTDTLGQVVRAWLPVAASLVDQIARRTAGSPLFAEQLMLHWIRTDALVDGPDGFRLRPGAGEALPNDLTAVWQARLAGALAGVDETGWQALEVAAVMGMVVEPGEWAEVCSLAGLSGDPAAIDRLADERLMRTDDFGRWSFAHAMLRETLLERARNGGRAAVWNAWCAEMLAGTAGVDPVRLAGHFLSAGCFEEALEPLLEGVKQARARGDFPTMGRLLLQRAQALRAARRPLDHPDWILTRIFQARYDQVTERLPAARRRSRGAVEAARAHDDPRLLAVALIESGRVEQTHDPQSAVDVLDEAIAVAAQVGDPQLIAEAMRRMGWCLALGGRFDEAEIIHARALDRLTGVDDPYTEGGIFHTRTLVAWKRQQYDVASRLGAEAMSRYVRTGDRFGQGNVSNTLGDIARYQGDLVEAERWYRHGLRLKRAVGAEADDTELNLALTLVDLGRYPEALARVEVVQGRARNAGNALILAFCAVTLLPCDAYAADWASWDSRWHDMDLLLTGKVAEPDAAKALRQAAALARSAGEIERAEQADALAEAQELKLSGR